MEKTIKELDGKFRNIFPALQENEEYGLYKRLSHLGWYYSKHSEDESANEIMKVIEKIYTRKDYFVCNAIENEFFTVLAQQFEPTDLTSLLTKMPESIWPVYIKVLFEIKKTKIL